MQMRLTKIPLSFIIIASILAGMLPFPHASAAVSDWQKSAAIAPRWNEDFASESFKESVRNLKAANANGATLVIPYYQSNTWSTDINRGWNTPTDESLMSAVQYVHSLGMQVTLKPHLETYDGSWRAYINPSDRDGWFGAYGAVLEHYAQLGATHGVEQIIIGSELISMSTYTSHGDNTRQWRNLISRIRGFYGGKLTYSANWGGDWFADEKNHIEFWNDLDAIGLAAYFNLWYVDGSLRASWDHWRRNDIQLLVDRYGKPLLFTEVGYRSVEGAHTEPWSSWRGGGANEGEQANDYKELFSYWNDYAFMQGVHWWDWDSDPNAGGGWTTSYTPQHKQAESVMRQWFGTPPAATSTPPDPGSSASFTSSASAHPSNPEVNHSVAIEASVAATNNGGTSNAIVDIEVKKVENGEKVFQQYFGGENFAQGVTRQYNVNWTPGGAGNYKVAIGVFGADWSTLHAWNDDAAHISVIGNTSPQSSLDIWWPANGSRVRDIQTFKATMTNRDVSTYNMYWRVDGDTWNQMYIGTDGGLHKAAQVDVRPWNWRGEGPYTVNFMAQDFGGAIIGTKETVFTVEH